MTSNVSLSSTVRANLESLRSTNALLSGVQERLSTGKKINSPLENSAAFFQSKALNTRAADLSGLLDQIGQDTQTIGSANNGLDALSDVLATAKGVLKNAVSTKTVATTTSGDVGGASTALASPLLGSSFSVTNNGASTTITVSGTDTLNDVITSINAISNVSASLSGTTLSVSASNGRELTIAGATGTHGANLNSTSNNGTNRDNFVTSFTDAINQIDSVIADTQYRGVNLLQGDNLTATFSDGGNSELTVTGTDLRKGTGIKITDSLNSTTSFETDANINALLAEVKAAETAVNNASSSLSTFSSIIETRQNFLSNYIGTLQEGASKLVASDTNKDGAELLALRTRQQVATSALQLSTQTDQSILRLL